MPHQAKGERYVPPISQELLDYLNRIFPEDVSKPSDSNDLYIQLGKRAVVKHLEFQANLAKQRKE